MARPALQSDLALVARCCSGDRAAWQQLVNEHVRIMHAAIIRSTRLPPEDREDILQSLVVHLLENGCQRLSRYRGDAHLSTWLASVARNYAIDVVRKRMQTNTVTLDEAEPSAPGWSERLLQGVDLDRAFSQLDPLDRMILRLVYQEGLSYEQVAQVTRLPVNTLASRILRAKRRLHGMLQD